MSIYSKTITSKIVAGAAGAAMALSMTTAAFAQTTTSTTTTTTASLTAQISGLLATIASLQAQLATMQGGTTSTGGFMVSLKVGSRGADVVKLQMWLESKGYLTMPNGVARGYFGALTKVAVMKYQMAAGITPASGYFGPITRGRVNAEAAVTGGTTTGTTTTTTTGTTALQGGEGSLDNFKIVGSLSTSLHASDSNTIYGFEFKAGGSDLAVNRVDYDFYLNDTTGSTRPWNIFKTATLMNGSQTVATVDMTDMNNWSQDGTASNGNQIYRLRFDNVNNVVKMGNTADYYLMVSTQNAISDSNIGGSGATATWAVNLTGQGVRSTDARGLQQYSSATAGNQATVTISNSTIGSLTVSTGASNPLVSTVQGTTYSQTSGVLLTTFTLQAKDSDVNVYTIPATVATTSTTVSNLVRSFKLYQGSTLLDTETIAAGASSTFTFKNLNVKIPAGTTQNFSVQADINNIDGVTVPESSSVALSIGTSGTWDATNVSGDQTTVTGSVTGNAISFRTIGLSLGNPTMSSTVSSVGTTGTQQGTFTFVVPVTSFGQDIYLGTSTASYGYTLTGATTGTTSSILTSDADVSTGVGYVIHSGQTKNVTVSITATGASAYVYANLNYIKFGTTTAAVTASTATTTSAFQTSPVSLHS